MLGTIVNVAAIIAGGLVGMVLKRGIPDKVKTTVMQGIGLAVVLIGLQMALQTRNPLIVISSLVIGGIIGEFIGIEDKLHKLGLWLEEKVGKDKGEVAKAFVSTSLIYCVGAMGITGAIEDGLNGNSRILFAKAMLDGFSAIIFASTMGMGVLFSSVPVFLYQGAISLLAGWAAALLSGPVTAEMTATGGLLIVGIGINILGIKEIRVGNLLPAIGVAIIFASLVG
ncbi:MAG: DUF554 domain-containing protein [Clostridia bacterium]|nr:DUF554 domain-containing protein [Clostridia bacterium]